MSRISPATGQAGFTLVTAIFLLVVFGALGAYMLGVSGTQRATSTLALQGARAFHAAKSGVEWGVYRALNNTAVTCGGAPATPVTSTMSMSGTGLNGFSVAVTCRYTRHQEGGNCFYVFAIDSQAEYGSYGDPDYVSRSLRVTASDHGAPISGCP